MMTKMIPETMTADIMTAQAISAPVTESEIWGALESVFDPEIPKLSVVDLGVITRVELSDNTVNGATARVTMTPTFSGCPALHTMKADIEQELKRLPLAVVEVIVSFEVPWNSNRITERGRAILQESGFAPPPVLDEKSADYFSLDVLSDVACPHCGSRQTALHNPFGPTLCRSIHYCQSCQQAFEQFKPVF
jgi:ring-1,2-phenylacetyl-CoA epoxidase subunit PaaD